MTILWSYFVWMASDRLFLDYREWICRKFGVVEILLGLKTRKQKKMQKFLKKMQEVMQKDLKRCKCFMGIQKFWIDAKRFERFLKWCEIFKWCKKFWADASFLKYNFEWSKNLRDAEIKMMQTYEKWRKMYKHPKLMH